MNYLRRMQTERPVLFWVVTLVGFLIAFQLVLVAVQAALGPLGLPSWAPIVVVVAVLVLIARGQQRSG